MKHKKKERDAEKRALLHDALVAASWLRFLLLALLPIRLQRFEPAPPRIVRVVRSRSLRHNGVASRPALYLRLRQGGIDAIPEDEGVHPELRDVCAGVQGREISVHLAVFFGDVDTVGPKHEHARNDRERERQSERQERSDRAKTNEERESENEHRKNEAQ